MSVGVPHYIHAGVFVISRTQFGVNAVDMEIMRLVNTFRSSTDDGKLKWHILQS